MAQNFRRYVARNIGTSASTIFTADSYDTVIGVGVANTTGSQVFVDVYINDVDSSNDVYLIKNAPVVSGGSLELIDGGSKIVLASGDQLFVKSDTASSLDTVVGAVDDIST